MEKLLFYLRMTCINGLRVDLLESKKMIGRGPYETNGVGFIKKYIGSIGRFIGFL